MIFLTLMMIFLFSMISKYPKWTPERLEIVKTLVGKHTAEEIAEIMKTSPSSVKNACIKNKISLTVDKSLRQDLPFINFNGYEKLAYCRSWK